MSKIYYITNSRIPTEKANGIQIVNTCQALSDLGMDVELIIPKTNTKIGSVQDFYGIDIKFKIKNISSPNFFKYENIIGPAAYYLNLICFYIYTTVFLVFKKRGDIIYSRDYISSLLTLLGFVVFIEIHDIPYRKKFILLFLIKLARGLVPISNGLKDNLIEFGVNSKKIKVIHDAVDISKFDITLSWEEARYQLLLPLDKKIILYTGHLYKWKGVDVLLEASRLLPNDSVVYIVGGLPEDVELKKINYDSLIKSGRIVIIGPRPHPEIPLWLKAADVLVLPNLGESRLSSHFTSPLKLFEYMASYRPIVAADLPSIREILDTQTCLFFTAGDSKSLASSIETVLTDKVLGNQLSKNAHKKVFDYSWAQRASHIKEFIC